MKTNNVLPHGRSTKIDRSILLLLPSSLFMETVTCFGLCGSVYINYLALYHAIMHEFFNYCGTSLVLLLQLSGWAAPSCSPKMQTMGVDRRRSTQQRCSTAITGRTRIQQNPKVVLEAVREGNTAHAYRCSTIFVLLSLSVFMIATGQKRIWRFRLPALPVTFFLPVVVMKFTSCWVLVSLVFRSGCPQ